MDATAPEKSSTGLDLNLAAMLSYILIIGIIFLVIEKESKFVRFHATQSVALLVSWIVVWMVVAILSSMLAVIPILGWLIGALLWVAVCVAFLVAWIVCLVKAYQGEWYRLPILGDFSAKQAGV